MKAETIKQQAGFTLIETLVAISILLIGVLGPMSIATRGITDGFYVQNQTVATYLAQEGLEMLFAQIENNTRENPGNPELWLAGLDFCKLAGGCGLGIRSNITSSIIDDELSFNNCASNPIDAECRIAFHHDSGLYGSWSGSYDPNFPPPSGFTGLVFNRVLHVEIVGGTDANPKEALLTSTVDWTDRGISKSFTLSLYAYNRKAI